MNPEWKDIIEKSIPIIGTLLGAVIGALGTIIVTRINRRTEERKHIRELAFNAGIENWKGAMECWKKQGGNLQPLDHFIISAKLLSEKILEQDIVPEKITSDLKKLHEINMRLYDFYRDKKNINLTKR